MSFRKTILPLILLLACSCGVSLNCNTRPPPAGELLQTVKIEPGITRAASAGSTIHVCTVEPRTLLVWEWRDGLLAQAHSVKIGDVYEPLWLGGNEYLYTPGSKDPRYPERYLCVSSSSCDKPEHQWKLPAGWYCRLEGQSPNGKHTAVGLSDASPEPPPGYVIGRQRMKIGVIDANHAGLDWDCTLVAREKGAAPQTILPSDDGMYVALAPWEYGLAMIDVRAKKLLWTTRPPSETALKYASFSPDGKLVYAGGTEGCVYGMDVKTGEVLSRWVATDSGRSEYGWRITCLAASADGEWVAAGTGPSNIVCLFSARNGDLVRRIEHADRRGSLTLLAFSPDSSSIATLGGREFKVWRVPAVPSELAGNRPTTQPAQTNGVRPNTSK